MRILRICTCAAFAVILAVFLFFYIREERNTEIFHYKNSTEMKKILIIGAGGQIGSELVPHLRSIYGNANVVAADVAADKCKALAEKVKVY